MSLNPPPFHVTLSTGFSARRLSQEEVEKPWELLSIMRRKASSRDGPQTGVCHLPKLASSGGKCAECPVYRQTPAAKPVMPWLWRSSICWWVKVPDFPHFIRTIANSSCLDILSLSSVSIEQNLEHCSAHSKELPLPSPTPPASQFTDQKSLIQPAVQLTDTVNTRDDWTEHLKLRPRGISSARGAMGPRDDVFFKPSGARTLMTQQEMIHSDTNLVYRNQEQQPLISQVSLLTLDQETTTLTHPIASHMAAALPAQLPFLSPEVLRLLEVHVKNGCISRGGSSPDVWRSP
ncbi:hypothetical protein MC885_008449 [Smutsia gigantea]|nr:hypothetical protein MC885_008449 [Smutsia gigantea]